MGRRDQIVVRIYISREDFLDYYRGRIAKIRARGIDGRSVSFPARHLRPFVREGGINGTFRIRFEDGNVVAVEEVRPN